MSKNNEIKFDYNGETFELTDTQKFMVTASGYAYDSAQQARDAIDRLTAAKTKVAKRKIELNIITEKLTEHVITGIHAGTGAQIIKPKLGHDHGNFYPNTPTVVDALKKLKALRDEVSEFESSIWGYQLSGNDYLGRDFDLEKIYDNLEYDYAAKLALAEKGSK